MNRKHAALATHLQPLSTVGSLDRARPLLDNANVSSWEDCAGGCMMGWIHGWMDGWIGEVRGVTGDAADAWDKGGSHTADAHHACRSRRRPSTWNRGRGGGRARTVAGTEACWEMRGTCRLAGGLGVRRAGPSQGERGRRPGAQTTSAERVQGRGVGGAGRHQTSRQRPQWPQLTGEDELLLHHVDVPAGPPDGGAQHDLLGVVAAHAAGAVPAGGRSQVSGELQFLILTQSGKKGAGLSI